MNENVCCFLGHRNVNETYYPEKIKGSGRACYVERNIEMISSSRICVFYYDDCRISLPKSGTRIAFDYAVKQKKRIIRFPALLKENE